jgi:hypothetical protein
MFHSTLAGKEVGVNRKTTGMKRGEMDRTCRKVATGCFGMQYSMNCARYGSPPLKTVIFTPSSDL